MHESDPIAIAGAAPQRRLGWTAVIALHLVPGIVFALAKALSARGSTAYLALILAIPLCLVPVQIGIMAAWSRRATGKFSLRSALGYRAGGGVSEAPTVFVVFVPIAYVARARRNFLIGTVVHAMINLAAVMQIFRLTSQG
jgi:hypothetical protein